MYKDVNYQVKRAVGLRQSDPLSPLLFNLFLADFIRIFDAKGDPAVLQLTKIFSLQFADDILITAMSIKGLIHQVNTS